MALIDGFPTVWFSCGIATAIAVVSLGQSEIMIGTDRGRRGREREVLRGDLIGSMQAVSVYAAVSRGSYRILHR